MIAVLHGLVATRIRRLPMLRLQHYGTARHCYIYLWWIRFPLQFARTRRNVCAVARSLNCQRDEAAVVKEDWSSSSTEWHLRVKYGNWTLNLRPVAGGGAKQKRVMNVQRFFFFFFFISKRIALMFSLPSTLCHLKLPNVQFAEPPPSPPPPSPSYVTLATGLNVNELLELLDIRSVQ